MKAEFIRYHAGFDGAPKRFASWTDGSVTGGKAGLIVVSSRITCDLTPAQTLLGECFDALGLWEERIDGIDFEPVEEACRRRVWVAGFRPRMAA